MRSHFHAFPYLCIVFHAIEFEAFRVIAQNRLGEGNQPRR